MQPTDVKTIYASGTAYSVTNSAAALDFGTTDPSMTLDNGTWLLFARVNAKYTGTTYAANQTLTVKLRRTNNTASDITGGTTTTTMEIITTTTGHIGVIQLPPVLYTTVNTSGSANNDVITIFGVVSATTGAGTVDIDEASIIALRLF